MEPFHPPFSPDSACKQDPNLPGRRKQNFTSFFVKAKLSLFSHYATNPSWDLIQHLEHFQSISWQIFQKAKLSCDLLRSSLNRARHFLMLVCGGEKPVLLLSPTQHKSQSFACWNLAIAPNCGAKLPGPGSFIASAGAEVEWGIPGLPTFELFASEASYSTPGSNQHVNQHMGIAHG